MSQDDPRWPDDDEDRPRRSGPPRTSPAAIGSFVAGLLGCIPPVGALAIALGFLGIRATRDREVGGRGLAIAGLTLGVFGLAGGMLLYAGYSFVMTEMEQARGVAEKFIGEVAEGRFDEAQKLAEPGLDRAALAKAAEQMKTGGPFNELVGPIQPVVEPDGTLAGMFDGDAVFSRSRVPVHMRMIRVGATYRVQWVMFRSK